MRPRLYALEQLSKLGPGALPATSLLLKMVDHPDRSRLGRVTGDSRRGKVEVRNVSRHHRLASPTLRLVSRHRRLNFLTLRHASRHRRLTLPTLRHASRHRRLTFPTLRYASRYRRLTFPTLCLASRYRRLWFPTSISPKNGNFTPRDSPLFFRDNTPWDLPTPPAPAPQLHRSARP